MKLALMAAVAALALSACGGPAAPASETAATPETTAAAAAPAMTPAALNGPIAGKWKVTITSAGMTLPAQEICYEKQVSLEDAQKMQQQAGITCTEQSFAPTGDGMAGHSVCKMAANAVMKETTITTDTKVVGDFNTAYTMEMNASMDPAPPGVANPSTTSIKMERLGDCDAAAGAAVPSAPPAPH